MNKREYWKFLGSMTFTVMATCATMMVDAAVGGRFIGERFVSVVNLLMPVDEVFYGIAIFFGSGAVTVAAVAFGRGDIRTVRRCFTVGFMSMVVVLGLCLAVVFCLRSTIAWSLSDGGALYEDTLAYMSVLVFFSTLNGVYLIVRLFTAMVGRPQMVMVCALIQMLANFGFDILFVKVLQFGIKGLGYASIASVIIVLCILFPSCLKRNSDFRPVRIGLNEFVETLKRILKIGSGPFMVEATYIVFYVTMNALVLRFLGEHGMLIWSIVMMLYMVGYFVTGAAQETCISIGGRYLGASDKGSFIKVYRNSSGFVAAWICIVVLFVAVMPEKTLPLLGIDVQSIDRCMLQPILCAIPFIFGNNIMNLNITRLLQEEKVVAYNILVAILTLSAPLLFVHFCLVAPGHEWFGLTAMVPVYLMLGYCLSRICSPTKWRRL